MNRRDQIGRAARAFGLSLLLAAGWYGAAWADRVKLTSGGTLEGRARIENDIVRVEVDGGEMILPRSQVVSIERGKTRLELLEESRQRRQAWVRQRLEAEPGADGKALYRLTRDARERGFPDDEIEALMELVLGADRNHGGARHFLGYVRYDGEWVTREEAAALREEDRAIALRARGYLQHRGEWMLADEIDWHAFAEKWQRAINRAEHERDDALSERNSLKHQRDQALAEAAALQRRLASSEGDIRSLESDLRAAEQEIASVQADLDRAEHEVSCLESDLGNCRSRLGACRRESCDP
ncbi:hypothetical protein ABI59_20415 [Acidobacteria bacterium Mor1]|nr:hypothetical protein ABI59_20415 [Acidobacteria bacterium Mor1]